MSPPRASATPSAQPTLPVATAYLVTAKPGADLTAAAASLAKLPGVVKVTKLGTDRLRVDLTMDKLPDDGAKIRSELLKLGTVVVP